MAVTLDTRPATLPLDAPRENLHPAKPSKYAMIHVLSELMEILNRLSLADQARLTAGGKKLLELSGQEVTLTEKQVCTKIGETVGELCKGIGQLPKETLAQLKISPLLSGLVAVVGFALPPSSQVVATYFHGQSVGINAAKTNQERIIISAAQGSVQHLQSALQTLHQLATSIIEKSNRKG